MTPGGPRVIEPEHMTGDDELTVLRLLGSGRQREAGRMVRAWRDHDLVARVADLDARARRLAVGVPEIQLLVARVEAHEPADSRLRLWSHAVLAERLLLDADPDAARVAAEALAELEDLSLPTLPPLALRYARARLRRVVGVASLLAPIGINRTASRELLDLSIAELLACGFVDEVHITQGLAAAAVATGVGDDIVESHRQLVAARQALDDDRSIWPPMLDACLAVLAFEVGDLAGALAAMERIERSPERYRRPDAVAAYGRAFFRLVTRGASAEQLAGIERALAAVRRHDPRFAQVWHGHVAHTLADMASPAAAHFARIEADMPVLDPAHATERALLGCRVAALGGAAVDVDEALAHLEALTGLGRARLAGRTALRLAYDLARAGDRAGAERLRAWGLPHLPSGERATWWERWWASRIQPSAAPRGDGASQPTADADGSPPGMELAVVCPTVELTLDGQPKVPSDAQARLLALLAAMHPAPLHVERVADALWPEEPPEATRARLNSLVYRLRQGLGRHAPAVRRSGDLIVLDPDHCAVDLWRLRRDLDRGGEQRRAALATVRGNLCDAQLPYDEPLIAERHRFVAEWLRHAHDACRAGEAEPGDLAAALAALGLDADALPLPH